MKARGLKAYLLIIPGFFTMGLAAAGVPLIHFIGLKDGVVPPSENTLPLFDRYVQLDGIGR